MSREYLKFKEITEESGLNVINAEAYAGAVFEKAVAEAIDYIVAIQGFSSGKYEVKYDFNGVTVRVNKNTDSELLYRDYIYAQYDVWPGEYIGPEPRENLPNALEEAYRSAVKLQNEKRRERRRKAREKEIKDKNILDRKLQGEKLKLSDPRGWEKTAEANQDGYGAASMRYAENWAKLMQIEIKNGNDLKDIAQEASYEANTENITGFMHGAAESILCQTWKYGQELQKWRESKRKM